MYNGHKSRPAWNVALWLANDEGLYSMARRELRRRGTKVDAAARLVDMLPERTPDGYRYTKTTVLAAIRDF